VLGRKLGTCFDVCLLKEGGRYRMWFSWRPKASVALAESTDGIHWSEPVIVLRPNTATDWETDINRPVVLKKDNANRIREDCVNPVHSAPHSINGSSVERCGSAFPGRRLGLEALELPFFSTRKFHASWRPFSICCALASANRM
jgi:hypothetical protein